MDKAEVSDLLVSMALRITQYEEPVLRTKGEKIIDFDSSLRVLVQEMTETMEEANGIGIAAQQIGQSLQLCIVDVRGCENDFDFLLDGRKPPLDLFMPMAIANPELELLEGPATDYEEGCLSFSDIRGYVRRPEVIRLKYQDAEGHPHILECDGIFARCIQHEVDHLNGILFIDRMDKKTLRKLEPKLKKLKEETAQAIGSR